MLQVEPSGSGSGRVSSSDGAISCGSVCAGAYAAGTSAVLIARPGTGSALEVWVGCDVVSGTTCTVSANQDRTVTAIFSAAPDDPVAPGGRRKLSPY